MRFARPAPRPFRARRLVIMPLPRASNAWGHRAEPWSKSCAMGCVHGAIRLMAPTSYWLAPSLRPALSLILSARVPIWQLSMTTRRGDGLNCWRPKPKVRVPPSRWYWTGCWIFWRSAPCSTCREPGRFARRRQALGWRWGRCGRNQLERGAWRGWPEQLRCPVRLFRQPSARPWAPHPWGTSPNCVWDWLMMRCSPAMHRCRRLPGMSDILHPLRSALPFAGLIQPVRRR